jgi:hypothetical protein
MNYRPLNIQARTIVCYRTLHSKQCGSKLIVSVTLESVTMRRVSAVMRRAVPRSSSDIPRSEPIIDAIDREHDDACLDGEQNDEPQIAETRLC